MGSGSSSYAQHGNPVLVTFGGYTIQPYWLIIVQLLFIQTLQRIYSLLESTCKKEKKHIYIALEIAVMGPKLTS